MDEQVERREVQRLIRDTVRATVSELKAQRISLEDTEKAYRTVGDKLYTYFSGANYDEKLEIALELIRGDKYFTVLTAYYGEYKTISQIARSMQVTRRTIHANKKRLCMMIADTLAGG